MSLRRSRILIATLGTRGDVRPFCILGRRLAEAGHDVRIVTSRDYRHVIDEFQLNCPRSDVSFSDILLDPDVPALLHAAPSGYGARIGALRALARRVQDRFGTLMIEAAAQIETADLVIDNPFAFYAGAMARERGLQSVRVTAQPLLPSARLPAAVLGARDFGPLGNRLSYGSFRLVSPFLAPAYRRLRRETSLGRGLHAFTNPLAEGVGATHQIMAFSPHVSPPPGVRPAGPDPRSPGLATGYWFDPPAPGARLPDALAAFLAAGPPPILVGFGSMKWGAARNTELVLGALARWGGRAILAAGAGLSPPPDLPPNQIATGPVDYELLFPHLAGVVHHGGAGTTGATLRHGLPSIILPVIGDQAFWGRRVAALGAAEPPLPLSRVTASDLAAHLVRITEEPRFRDAARRCRDELAREPGVAQAVAAIESWLPARLPA